jgi:predicted DNA-binding transcriptional regulator AlpA
MSAALLSQVSAPAEDEEPRDARRARSALPAGALPRGFRRVQAAEYIGVGTTKFDEMVGDGRMPRPKKIDGRRVWDRAALDEAFGALPNDGDDKEGANEWDDLDA